MSTPQQAKPDAGKKALQTVLAVVATFAVIVGTIVFALQYLHKNTTGPSSTGVSTTTGVGEAPVVPIQSGPAGNWPTYLYNQQNTNDNTTEKTLTPQNIGGLTIVGAYSVPTTNVPNGNPATPNPNPIAIVSSPLLVGNTIFFGSWDGNEYAVTASIPHKLIWKKFLGVVTPPAQYNCDPSTIGVSADASVDNGTLFIGGADGNVYALDTATGNVKWKTAIAKPPEEILWSGNLVLNGHIYIGVGSYGDCPLIPGRMVELDEATGAQMALVWTDVKPNNGGVTIWKSKPAYDQADNLIIYGTGSISSGSQSDSVVAVNPTTMTVQSVWSVPAAYVGANNAFGSSCIYVANLAGGRGAVCHTKEGSVWGLSITPTGLQEAWHLKVAGGGQSPYYDEGDISGASYDGTYVYVDSTKQTINGVAYPSVVYALNPQNGNVVWQVPLTTMGYPVTPIVIVNGMLVIGMMNEVNPGELIVMNAADGTILYSHGLTRGVMGAPMVTGGHIYVPTGDGNLLDFAVLGAIPQADLFSGTTLGKQWGWTNQDTKHEKLTGQSLQMDAAGLYNVDNKNFLSEKAPADPAADFTFTVKVQFNPITQYNQVAVAAYQDTNNYVKVALNNQDGQKEIVVEVTSVINGVLTPNHLDVHFDQTKPIYLQMVRINGVYYGYASGDDINWIPISQTTAPITPVSLGLSAYSNNVGPYQTAQFYSAILVTY